jgi:hypothetical protein
LLQCKHEDLFAELDTEIKPQPPRSVPDKYLWHLILAPGRSAACAVSLGALVMALPDGGTVCDKPGHGRLITYEIQCQRLQ